MKEKNNKFKTIIIHNGDKNLQDTLFNALINYVNNQFGKIVIEKRIDKNSTVS